MAAHTRDPAGKGQELTVMGVVATLAAYAGAYAEQFLPGLGAVVTGALVGLGAIGASFVRDKLATL